jgi:fibronectin-binding autotransporter adhesin
VISGNISGATQLTKTGAGLLELSGANTYAGALNVNAGTLRVTAGTISPSSAIVAAAGNATMAQTGGTIGLAGLMQIGSQAAGNGVYALSGGTLNGGEVWVGAAGTGVVNHSAGTLNTTSGVASLRLGNNASGVGTYNLTGASAVVNTTWESVGYDGHGTFAQSDGTHAVGNGSAGGVFVGDRAGSVGSYNLSGG